MNMTDKTRSYIWLVFGVLSLICAIIKIADVTSGDKEWGNLITMIVTTVFFFRYYLCYRRKSKAGG